jgi:hypothetical protein
MLKKEDQSLTTHRLLRLIAVGSRSKSTAISLLPLQVLAWGATGHQLVCAMAEQPLTPGAHQWPDTARHSTHMGSYEQHFINVQASATSIDLARDCHAMDCNVIGIRRSLVYLAQPTDTSVAVML